MRKYSLDRMSVFALKNGLYTGEVWPEEETGEALSRVRRLLPRVMEGMLTPRQRQYVTLYFFEQKKTVVNGNSYSEFAYGYFFVSIDYRPEHFRQRIRIYGKLFVFGTST